MTEKPMTSDADLERQLAPVLAVKMQRSNATNAPWAAPRVVLRDAKSP